MPITKQSVAIIGSNSMLGSAIAQGLCRKNYRLLLFDEDPAEAQKLYDRICSTSASEEADVEVLDCQHLASWEADVIIIALQDNNLDTIPKKVQDVVTQKTVCVILKSDGTDRLNMIERKFPDSKVVGLVTSPQESDQIEILSKHTRALETINQMAKDVGLAPDLKKLNHI